MFAHSVIIMQEDYDDDVDDNGGFLNFNSKVLDFVTLFGSIYCNR